MKVNETYVDECEGSIKIVAEFTHEGVEYFVGEDLSNGGFTVFDSKGNAQTSEQEDLQTDDDGEPITLEAFESGADEE